jgi:Spy/CpxP family protein refolding chaperone
MSRRTKTFLTLSVLLNILLAGVAGGMVIEKWQREPWHNMKELAPDTRNLLGRSYQEARAEMSATFREMREARKEINEVLEAEPFDAAAFEAGAQRMQKAQRKMIDRKIEIMKELAPQIPPEERQKLSSHLMRPYKKGDHKFGPDGPGEKPAETPTKNP